MYGLEKNPKAAFEMDLEKDLKKDPTKAREMIKNVEEKIQEIKGLLRDGSKGADFDNLGVLLHGYTAMLKILNKFISKK